MKFKEVRVPHQSILQWLLKLLISHSVMIEITDRLFKNSTMLVINRPSHARKLWRANDDISEKGMRLIDALFEISPVRLVRILRPERLEIEVWPANNIKDVLPEIREVFVSA